MVTKTRVAFLYRQNRQHKIGGFFFNFIALHTNSHT